MLIPVKAEQEIGDDDDKKVNDKERSTNPIDAIVELASRGQVLLFVSPSADSICACRILTVPFCSCVLFARLRGVL